MEQHRFLLAQRVKLGHCNLIRLWGFWVDEPPMRPILHPVPSQETPNRVYSGEAFYPAKLSVSGNTKGLNGTQLQLHE